MTSFAPPAPLATGRVPRTVLPFRLGIRTVVLLLWGVTAAVSLAGCQASSSTGATAGRSPASVEASDRDRAASEAPGSYVASGVAAANPLAVNAGLEVLRAGGSAADAAVAVQTMLGLVEPQSSGIGGGAFLLYYDAATRKVTAFDGREMAPKAAQPTMFLDAGGKPLSFPEAVTSGRSTGVPGVMPMLGALHERYGKRGWGTLFEPAIRTAEQGFTVPQRLGRFVNGSFPQAQLDPRKLFVRADGTSLQAGDQFRNPAYGATLRRLATQGPRALLESPLADEIVARLARDPLPGAMTTGDLAAYQPVVSEALCGPYRVYVVCVPPPPSSGVSLLQMLAILDHTDVARRGADDPQAWYLFAEASRLMYADRDRYVADPAFVPVPVAAMLDPAYVGRRAELIGAHAGPPPAAGELDSAPRAADRTLEAAGTSHFVVVDAWGNVAAMTTSVESVFGSGRSVGGFMLNNQLTDFSFDPVEDGRRAANAVAGGKRPRSSMSPVIVLDRDGGFVAAVGSPGGGAVLA
jgi:gamma-glutamyltranspeptidase/glutathione hydrolase